jgi:hypothetical protein
MNVMILTNNQYEGCQVTAVRGQIEIDKGVMIRVSYY